MWGKLPVPKYISHPIFKDNAAATTAFQNGDIDVAQIFITDLQKLWLEQDLPISTYVDEAPYQLCMTMPTLFFNTEVEGLDQVAVRKAIAMAVDYDQVIFFSNVRTVSYLRRCSAFCHEPDPMLSRLWWIRMP